MTGWQIGNQLAGAAIMFIGVLTGWALSKTTSSDKDDKHDTND